MTTSKKYSVSPLAPFGEREKTVLMLMTEYTA